MQQTNGPYALRVAGRHTKDTIIRLVKGVKAWLYTPTAAETAAWLDAHYPWAIPLIHEAIAQAIVELRTSQRKEAGRE